ncbi:glycosyltransferase [Mucilaginibacter jinjuensis]|uniref:Glycosyltransferase n=1 Tax=Mucilaginibacter jinjuensis TaxID=1176721 RepID=A0ABY7TAD5_9SPHI|nr:glycosyltransferase [Mucilaginibacter jinjuensis]WCT13168.1 glycosyltransferase [Mucilaginibacter jinjuensis]
MKNVVFVMHRFRTGGVEKMFINIVDQLRSEKVYLIVVHKDFDGIAQQIPGNVEIIDFDHLFLVHSLRRVNGSLQFLSPLLAPLILVIQILYCKFLLNLKQDVTINFSDTFSSLILTYVQKGEKFSWIHSNPRVIKNSSLGFLYSFLYKKCDQIICICNDQKKLFLDLFKIDEKSTKVVYNTIDTNVIDKYKNEELKTQDEKFILMVSRIDNRSKDFISVIKAYNLLWLEDKNIPCMYIVGAGPDEGFIKSFIKELQLEDRIILKGNDTNPYKWMKNASIFIFSSKSEGFGLVLIEAMYCEVPVIATDCEVGPREILKNGEFGQLVQVGDVLQLKNGISEILRDDNIGKIKALAKERAASFSTQNRDLMKEIF